jgi:RNA polymerase-associated protein
MATPNLILYDVAMSSYAQKIRTALRFKNLPFKSHIPPNLGSGYADPDFLATNPRLEVPALVDGDFKVFDSTAIIMYLEDAYTSSEHPSLFPPGGDGPREKADARMIEEVCDTHYEAINWAFGEVNWFKRAQGSEADRLNEAVAEQTGQIFEWLLEKLGAKPFFSGDSLGYADICVAPMLNRSVINKIGPVEGTPLHAWHKRMGQIPCVKATWDEVAEAAPKMAAMGPETWKKGAGRRREYRDHRLEFFIKNGAIDIVQRGLEDDNIRFSWPQPKEQAALKPSSLPL